MYKHVGVVDAAPFRRVLPTYYRKRKVIVIVSDTVTLSNLNWDGGSRKDYTALTLDGLRVTGNMAKYAMMAPWSNPAEGKTLPLPSGYIVVSGGTFCGKPAAITLYINPHDTRHPNFKGAEHILPAPPVDEPAPYVAHDESAPRGWLMIEGGARAD